MTNRRSHSRGEDLATRRTSGIRQAEQAARPGARELPVVEGLTQKCQFLRPMENVLMETRDILINSETVFIHGRDIAMEVTTGTDRSLVTLTAGYQIETRASSLLANVFVCDKTSRSDESAVQFPPPAQFVALLLNSDQTRDHLPRITTYAMRPVFDDDFQLRGPGWHPDIGLLVHGPEIEIVLPSNMSTTGPARDRLPPRLRELLHDFCLHTDADVANVVGVLLTAMLMPHFVSRGKPICLLDANQPGTGKTLLALTIGRVFDGRVPRVTSYSADDEELGKRVCATLRDNPQSQVIIDNAKVPAGTAISSPFVEANSTAPVVSLRILGQSATFERSNDLLWFITMNGTQASPDIVSRCVPIRFRFEGDPGRRDFGGRDPGEFAQRHRLEILGELAGMVTRWTQAGRPRGERSHRCSYWAEIIGGILCANLLPEFLLNLDGAAVEFNASLGELVALAEEAIRKGKGFVVGLPGTVATTTSAPVIPMESPSAGQPPAEWEPVFQVAGVLDQELGSAVKNRAKSTRIGRYLSQHIGREVQVEYGDSTLTARLRVVEGRSRQKRYHFEVMNAEERPDAPPEPSEVPPALGSQIPPSGIGGGYATPPGNQEDW